MQGTSDRVRASRVLAAATAVGLATTLTVGVAMGAPKTKTKRAETTLSQHEIGSATATCKKRTQAVAGGFDAPGFDATFFTGPSIEPIASTRDSKRRWTATSINYLGEGELVTFAYCRSDLPKLRVRSAVAAVPNGGRGSTRATCRRGEEAVSGGFSVATIDVPTTIPSVIPSASSRSGKRGWVVEGLGVGPDAAMTAYAYCAPETLRLKTKSASVSSPPEDDGALVSTRAKCRRGQEAISGGLAVDFKADTDAAEPVESHRAGRRGWVATVLNNANDEGIDLHVFAYCLKKGKKG
jgi:hypothetical protein